MINIPILKKNFREHICLWGIVTAVLVLYLFLLLGTYAPDGKAGVKSFYFPGCRPQFRQHQERAITDCL